ncbi:MAG: type II secretion system F family protein [Parcubacteria group bacterium]|jgi:type IV pilus assembly protein PilC
MKFKYKARTQASTIQEGIVEASTLANATSIIQRHNLVVVAVDPVQESEFILNISRFWEGVKAKEFVIFSRQLAVLLEAKVPLMSALKGILGQTSNPYLAKILSEVLADVDEGKSLSESLKKHPDVFSDLYINMVQAGEVSGNLQETLNKLADNIEKNYLLTQKVKGVLYYPAFIMSAFFVVGFIMVTFVIPKLTSMLKETNVALPITTRALIWIGDFMTQYWWAVILVVAAAVVGLIYYLRTAEGKKEFDVIKLKMPIVGKVFRYIYLARFAENLSTLVRSGIPIVTALQIAGRVIDNSVFEAHVFEAAENVKTGGLMSDVMAKKKDFPPVMVQMVKVGEETGKLDMTLTTMAKFYTQEADQIISNLSSIIEPILIIILGVAVGVLVFSIIIPIYNIAQGIK